MKVLSVFSWPAELYLRLIDLTVDRDHVFTRWSSVFGSLTEAFVLQRGNKVEK